MSTEPYSDHASSKRESKSSHSVTSQRWKTAALTTSKSGLCHFSRPGQHTNPPALRISSTVLSPPFWSRSPTTTFALKRPVYRLLQTDILDGFQSVLTYERFPKSRAVAFPKPLAAPVALELDVYRVSGSIGELTGDHDHLSFSSCSIGIKLGIRNVHSG